MTSLTKAYIISKKDNTYKVRIPIYHGIKGSANSTDDSDLPYASVSTLKGISNIYLADDIVYVYFEDNDLSKPVIIGSLLYSKKESNYADSILSSIEIKDKAVLPTATSIGKITATEINALSDIKTNIQSQFNNISNCTSSYTADYYASVFENDTSTWILGDKGLALHSAFKDDNNILIDTYDYIQANSKTGNKTWTLPDNSIIYQSDGYDRDKRLRLNWQGISSIENDKVKLAYGLYARNYWDLTKGNLVSEEYLAQPEYTWRPTIQSLTNDVRLKACTINNQDVNVKTINTGYFPYSMQINPDGGDVYIGRRGYVSVIDHNETVNDITSLKQGLKIDTLFLDVSEDKLYVTNSEGKRAIVGSGSGSGSVFFTYDNDIDANGSIYSNPYLAYKAVRNLDRKNIYSQFADGFDTDRSKLNALLSGMINVTASIVMNVNQVNQNTGVETLLGRFPVSAGKSVQLSALMDLSKTISYTISGTTTSIVATNQIFTIKFSELLSVKYKARYKNGRILDLIELDSAGNETSTMISIAKTNYTTDVHSENNKITLTYDSNNNPVSANIIVGGISNKVTVLSEQDAKELTKYYFYFPAQGQSGSIIYDICGDYIYSRKSGYSSNTFVLPKLYKPTYTASITKNSITASVAIEDASVMLNLTDTIGINFYSIAYAFIISVCPIFDEQGDIISLIAQNLDSSIIITDLTQNNIIGMYKKKMLAKVQNADGSYITDSGAGLSSLDANYVYLNGYWYSPATYNVSINYSFVDVENVALSTTIIDTNPKVEESI